MIVIFGFSCAGYLINSSYSAWQESPVSTTVETRPISDLDFPTVTVCPPKGSHTALNYDLMKADNHSLTEQDRLVLMHEAHQIFIKPSHLVYIESMFAAGNPENVKQMFEGFQTTPKPYGGTGFETIGWNNQGTFRTPMFGESYNEGYYKEDKVTTLSWSSPRI